MALAANRARVRAMVENQPRARQRDHGRAVIIHCEARVPVLERRHVQQNDELKPISLGKEEHLTGD
jgi:hypothetical protein